MKRAGRAPFGVEYKLSHAVAIAGSWVNSASSTAAGNNSSQPYTHWTVRVTSPSPRLRGEGWGEGSLSLHSRYFGAPLRSGSGHRCPKNAGHANRAVADIEFGYRHNAIAQHAAH